MFTTKNNHICTIENAGTSDVFPPLEKNASCSQRLKRWWLKQIIISETNPSSLVYFRSEDQIRAEKQKQIDSGSWCIHPFSKFQTIYSIYVAILYAVSVVVIPFSGSFPKVNDNLIALGINNCLNICCNCDILMQFLTGYVNSKDKQVVMKPGKIATRYIFSWQFPCDILSSLPQLSYDMYTTYTFPWVISSFSLLKCSRIPTLGSYLSFMADYFKINGYFVKLVKVFILTLLFLHFFTCLMYLQSLIAFHFHQDANTWINKVIDKNTFSKYVYSAYRASSYVFAIEIETLGKRQVFEHYMACFVYICGKLYCMYTIVVVLDLHTSRHALQTKYFAVMSQVNCYMKAKKLKPVTRQKILAYYDYKFNNKYFKAYNLNTFFSEQLKNEINASIYVKLLREVSILAELPKDALQQILSNLKTELFLPNDVIIRAGAYADCMFFLASGTVAVYTPTGAEICHLQDGAYFGEISLLCDVKRTASVVAVEICKIYTLRGTIFKKCFSKNPELYRSLKQAAEFTAEVTLDMDLQFQTRGGSLLDNS